MKYLFNVKMVMVSLFSLLFLKQTNVLAQTPNTGIFFQAIARDQYANPAKDRKIYVQSSIVQATATGTKVLIEEHQTTTDGSGVFSISVGQGTRTGGTVANLDKVEWAKGPYYLNLKIAITPMAPVANWDYTKDLIDLGTSPFGTVPYALYAGSSGALDSKLNIVDTVKMLSIYAKAVNVNDIANQVKTKLSVQDTTTMLAPYARMVNELIASNITSLTAETINQALDAKVNLADSLTKYVTPTQLNTKTFDSSAIYNQLALREKLSNKSINVLNDATSNDKFPSVKAIKDYVDTEIAGVTIQDGSITDAKIIGLSGSKITGNIAGNAGTATKIATPVTINGVSFDGSSNITIASAAANTLTMNASGTGDASGSTFDGSAAKTISYNTIGASPLAGSSSLTTVGTIETGVWSGTAIDVTKGGTGLTKITNGQLLFGNGTNTIGNSSNLFWNNTTNSFGIGTNTPGSGFGTILDVNGSASFRTNGANSGLKFDGYSPYGTLNVARIYTEATSGTASDFILGTYSRNSDQLYLKESNGFVGIRNSNPTTALDVNGTVTATEFAGPLIGNVTGNSTTAITAGNITATSNITLTSLSNLTTVGTITSGVWSGTAIDYTKLNIAGAVKNSDVAEGAGIAYSKLNLIGSIVNSDIDASAAIADSKLATITTMGKVSNSATTATDLNTASSIVARDASGNFTAGTITGTLSGTATNITATSNTTLTSLPSLTEFGTITSGVWSGTAIAISKGGTGANSASAALANLGAEPTLNKSSDNTLGASSASDILFPSQKAVKTYVDLQFSSGGVADNSITDAKLVGGITAAKLVGMDITKIGTITTGTWNGTTIAVANGGTGATTLTGYLKGNGTSAFTASSTIPIGDIDNGESILNRATATDLGASSAADSKYPSQLAVKTYVDTKVAAATIADADAGTKGKIQLTGDLGNTATSPSVVTVGGSTAANIHSAELAANAATDANTVSTIVKRNSAGDFSAGTITANLVGNVTGNVSGTAASVTGIVTGAKGGTGIDNGSKTLTIGGDFVTAGTGALSLTYSGTTNVTLPSTGTLATLSGSENLNNKIINGLTLNTLSTGFSINGGTISKTLTISDDATLSGTNTGDQTIVLSGDLSGSGTGVISATLSNTGVTAGTYGSATTVPNFTVDEKGRITNVTNTTITGVSPIGSSLTSGNIFIGNGGVVTSVPITGDFTINSNGVGTISATSITNNMLAGGIDLTNKVSGALPVANGGTGATSLTGYLKGNGTNAFTSITTIPVADITGAVRSVNGQLPTNGDVVINYGTVTTGTLSNINTPTNNGDLYVVSNDDQSSLNNGRTFITTGSASTSYSWTEVVSNQATTDARYVRLSGGTMSGNLTFPSTSTLSLDYTPTSSNDATNKSYVDNLVTTATPSATASATGKIQLAGDLGGLATSPTILTVGGSTASDIANATALANEAVYSNTANAIVRRDVSGNFSAGTITANLTGNVTGNVSGNAANVTGIVAVSNGGSGANTLTGYIKGNGTNAYTAAAAIPVADVTNAESNANKSSATDLGGASSSNTNYPTQLAVKSYVDTKVAAATIADADASTKGKIQLAGDLGNTAASPTVVSVGGSSASNINTATTLANASTASNTASAIVRRDAAGNFSAGTITANLTGNVTGNVSGNAANVTGIISGVNGGTGVANTGKTITLGGNLVTSGAYSTTFTVSNNTNISLPSTGTLSTLAGLEALTNKTINGLTPSSQTTGFTIAGGNTNSKTLTVSNDANISGTNTGDQTITLTGDLTGTGTGSFNTTLSNSGVTSGTYGSSTAIPTLTIDSKGRIISANTTSIVAGVNTVNTIAAISNANGATISGTSITLTPADATNGGIVTNGTQTFAGTKIFSATISGTISGNAGSATKLQTGRTIALTGDLTYTSPTFDGTANVTAAATLANSGVVSGTYGSSTAIPALTIDSKGRITSATTTSIIAGVNTVASIAGTSNASGATISGTSITLTPADGTNGGVVTNGAQTFAGIKTFSNTTSSTATTNGAVIVSGGVGIGGAIYAGSVQNTPIGSTTASTAAFTTLSATGATSLGSTLNTTGAATFSSTMNVNGATTLAAVTATAAATFSSTVKITTGAGAGKVLTSDATGNATWNANPYASLFSITTATATTAYAADLTKKYIIYSYATAEAGKITVPAAATANAGAEIIIKNKSGNVVTISSISGTIYIDNANTSAASVALGIEASNNWVKLVSDGTQWIIFRALF